MKPNLLMIMVALTCLLYCLIQATPQCPQTDVNLQGRSNPTLYREIRSWQDCSFMCDKIDDCNAWLWHHSNAGQYKYQCVMMEAFEYTSKDTNCISGMKNCVGQEETSSPPVDCLKMDTNLHELKGKKTHKNTYTYQKCSDKCEEENDCNAWVWHKESAGRWAFYCVLVTSFGYISTDKNCISSKKICMKPTISGLNSMIVREGDTADINAEIKNLPSDYEWIYEDREGLVISKFESKENNSVSTKLTFDSVPKGKQFFILKASNSVGTASKPFYLRGLGIDENNFDISVDSNGEDFINLDWKKAILNSQTLKSTIIRYRVVGEGSWSEKTVSNEYSSVTLNVLPLKKYEITMIGGDGSSTDLTSNTITITTVSFKTCDIDNCDTCKPRHPRECQNCAEGFGTSFSWVGQSKLVSCKSCKMEHCKTCAYDNEGRYGGCKSCETGYGFVNGVCEANLVMNCAEESNGICKWCQLGYYKNYDGTCKPCSDTNCDYCHYGGPCLACKANFKWNDKKICTYKGGDIPYIQDACLSKKDNVCQLCSSKFFLKDENCTACNYMDVNCVDCNKDGACRACKINYEVNDGQCVPVNFSNEEKRTISGEDSNEEVFDETDDEIDYEQEEESVGDTSWGFENRTGMGEDYYMEVEVQIHVSQTTYLHYLASTRNNHKYALEYIRERWLSAYNYLGFGLNRMIVDDEDEKKIFVNIVPWEIMIYMDNAVVPISLKTKKNGERSTNSQTWLIEFYGQVKLSLGRFLDSVKSKNGHVADLHFYASTSVLGFAIGVAVKPCCFGIGIGKDAPGGLVGHELGHNIGMPDYRGPDVTAATKHGKPGSYYSKYQVTKMKKKILGNPIPFKESLCEPILMEDGRIVGRVNITQRYFYGDAISRNQMCKWFAGDECVESENSKMAEEKNCEVYECTCNGIIKEWKVNWGIHGTECGKNKRCNYRDCKSLDVSTFYDWRKTYSVSNVECSNAIDIDRITDARIVENYDCIDAYDDVCLYGPASWKELIFPSA